MAPRWGAENQGVALRWHGWHGTAGNGMERQGMAWMAWMAWMAGDGRGWHGMAWDGMGCPGGVRLESANGAAYASRGQRLGYPVQKRIEL